MIYIFETELKENKPIYLSLTHIYGIGKNKSLLICKKLGFSKSVKVNDLNKNKIKEIIKTCETLNYTLASDLKKTKNLILKKLIAIKSYKGLRRLRGLPVRGQRTHTNAKTSRKIK